MCLLTQATGLSVADMPRPYPHGGTRRLCQDRRRWPPGSGSPPTCEPLRPAVVVAGTQHRAAGAQTLQEGVDDEAAVLVVDHLGHEVVGDGGAGEVCGT